MSYVEGNPRLLENLCSECAVILQGKYPHVAWGVRPSIDGSMIQIQPFGINADANYAFVEKTTVLQQESGRKRLLMRIGGEILERYRIDRAIKDTGAPLAKMNKRGLYVPDMS